MEVILIKDLKRKGNFGDTIDVADGYARNYLIPNGFALIANNANKKRFEEMKEKAMANVSELRARLQSAADQIKGKTFTMTALSRDGKLYGSITPSIIVNDMINKELPELKISASDIIIDDGNIKFVGTYGCKAQFTKNISASFTITIESDESDEQPELLEAFYDDELATVIDADVDSDSSSDDATATADDSATEIAGEQPTEDTVTNLDEETTTADASEDTDATTHEASSSSTEAIDESNGSDELDASENDTVDDSTSVEEESTPA